MIDKLLEYSDIALDANFYDGGSRSNLDTSVTLGNHTFKMPVVPSNMACSINFELAELLSQNDYFYVLHRFYKYSEIKQWLLKRANVGNKIKTISISVGVQTRDYDLIKWIASNTQLQVDFITIDIAHGYSEMTIYMLQHINAAFTKKNRPFVIAGNVMSNEAVVLLNEYGADAVKVGIGGGSPCSTKYKTGFTKPMFSTVLDCAYLNSTPVIADGGIKCHGDIAKALVAGATMVMIGGMFTACKDSPAETINKGGIPTPHGFSGSKTYKRYYGSASAENKGHKRNVEGFVVELECNNMTYLEKMEEMQMDLQSAMSYGACSSLSMFKEVRWNTV